jgi:hypothetical protein
MSKRDDSSLILRNLKKVDLPSLGQPVVPLDRAEKQLAGANDSGGGEVRAVASSADIMPDSSSAIAFDSRVVSRKTRLQPKHRAVRSALIVRLHPDLHRRLDEVARYNSLTMNDIVTEAIELHLQNFAHPPPFGKPEH